MEFRFNVNKLLPKRINKITHTLIPENFRGDRRELLECQRHITRIVDEMGEASAKAQGLSKPITSAVKLRDTDHIIYLLVDSEGNNNLGSIIGLLKTGSKNLFMFDERGVHYQLQPRCVLDFYIHESRQRMGLGNILYQHMLSEEDLKPIKLAIDRPSEKFLAFLQKYYNLETVIPQNNKFVVFTGFFDDEIEDIKASRYSISPKHSTVESRSSTPNQSNHNSARNNNNNSINGTPVARSAFGRYAAARPPCHMANIIHNTAMLGQPTERSGDRSSASPKMERPHSLSIFSENDHKKDEVPVSPIPSIPDEEAVLELDVGNALIPDLEQDLEIKDEIPDEIDTKSPSNAQDSSNQPAHLDLKFYHSPLW